MTDLDRAAALRPLARALLAAAHADAADAFETAARQAREILEKARTTAAALRAEADAQGTTDAEAEIAARRVAVARTGRGRHFAARRAAYERLRRLSVEAAVAMREDPRYPALLGRLRSAARETLGPAATISEDPAGGVAGEADGRRLSLTLPEFLQQAFGELSWQMSEDGSRAANADDRAPETAAARSRA